MATALTSRIEDFKSSLQRLSQRERLALFGLGISVVLVIVVIVSYVILSGLEELEEQNAALRQALDDLNKHSATFMQQRRRMASLEGRMNRAPLELNSFVEGAAKNVGISISESGEISPVSSDKYTQRGLEVKLRKVSIEQLAKFLRELESSPQIVQITRLNVSARWNQHEDLDVELVVSTFEMRRMQPGEMEDRRREMERQRERERERERGPS